MNQFTLPTSLAPEVIFDVTGSLQVQGWERPEIAIRAQSEALKVDEKDDIVEIKCESNCAVRLPYGSTVHVTRVEGDARFKLLEDLLTIEKAMGHLSLRSVAETQIEIVQGDLDAKHITGNLSVDRAEGNTYIREVQGSCTLADVQGNLDVRNVESDIDITAQGNARLRLNTLDGSHYRVQAAGNLNCRIPDNASARFSLQAGAEEITLQLPNQPRSIKSGRYTFTLAEGLAEIDLSAEGNLFLGSQTGLGGEENLDSLEAEIDSISESFSQQINQQIESQIESQMEALTRQLNEQMANISNVLGKSWLPAEESQRILERARQDSERATARAQERMHRAQEKMEAKLEATRRRTELKAQAAQRRQQAANRRGRTFEWSPPSIPSAKESVSDEERLLILRMLEQKKITLAEAEELLAALEGKNG
ncbi:MAG TPA: hypothetical protein VN363_01480 [Anaerolineales bacterium]|nr:hypothetical protein [Anaerolineales bacterium]